MTPLFENAVAVEGLYSRRTDQIGRQSMKQSTKDKAKGKFHEVRGRVKEKIGRVTNNPNLEAEGRGEKIGGKVRKRIGQVKKVLGI